MRSPKARLRVEGLEDRWTPATMADMLSAARQVAAGQAFFRAAATDPDWMFNPALRSIVSARLTSIFQAAQSAATTASQPVAGLPQGVLTALTVQARGVQAQAARIADMVGVSVRPTPAPGVTPRPPVNDAGMTNTMPDANASNWVAQGTQGLKTWDVVTGSGTPVSAGDSITVFYTGWLAANGTRFDARRSPSAPATFSLNGLIQGWQQGIVGMRPGGIRRLYVPAALGYGAAGSPPNIPADADLIFEIKLVSRRP